MMDVELKMFAMKGNDHGDTSLSAGAAVIGRSDRPMPPPL